MADATTAPPERSSTLKPGAIGFVDALVIGLASTSPAYSLAAVIGPIVLLVGVAAPGVLLASFVPMLLIASAFYFLNRVDQDCGTTFSWVTRALGPWFGWLGGWAIFMTGVLVIGSLAEVGVLFTLFALGLDGVAENTLVVRGLTVLLILIMTWLCVLGTEMSARLQNVLILAQVAALMVFAGVALWRATSGDSSLDSITPSLSWLNPFAAGGAALSGGLLLGVFAYWGWESAVNLTEETEDSASAPGRAGIVSTVVLLVTYVAVAFAVVAYAGTSFLAENSGEEEYVFALLSSEVMGGLDWVVYVAVATSAVASTQTTIIPASRTGLSMARRAALPHRLAHIHPRFRTPDVSTWTVAGIAIAWYLVVSALSENALFDSLTALSLLIAFYYALTGIACAVYYRRHLTDSARNLVLIGVGPVVGAVLLLWLLVRSVIDMSDPENSYSGQAWFGIGPPLVIGIGIAVTGVVVMLVWRTRDARFWQERAGVVDPALLGDTARPDGDAVMSIVLGYDESPGAKAALATAIELAQRFERPLVLVYGVAPPGGLGEEFRSHARALSEIGEAATAHAVEQARAAGVEAVVELVQAKPADALVQVADQHDAAVIVVGLWGESPLKGAVLGSTPHRLLHISSRPVLCVPATSDGPDRS